MDEQAILSLRDYGKAMKGEYSGHWRYRIDNSRVIYLILYNNNEYEHINYKSLNIVLFIKILIRISR